MLKHPFYLTGSLNMNDLLKSTADNRCRNTMARIFNIQRYSLNDGDGIRTVIFFKGCPHTCPWCANPESISVKKEVVRRISKCLQCMVCKENEKLCPTGAWEVIGKMFLLMKL